MRDLEDEARIKAYMEAKMKHIKRYTECMNLADGLDVEKFAELVRADEREACAKVCDARANEDGFEGGYADQCAIEIRARGDVHASDISQERVDETAKSKHEPVAWYGDADGFPVYAAPSKREWVGLTDEERGMVVNANFGIGVWEMARAIEAKLKEKNA